MTKNITLTQGKVALVDDEDYESLSSHKWRYHNAGYAVRTEGTRSVLMHRVIMQAPVGMEVDHINRDRLDNRRTNLRLCSHMENCRNNSTHKGSSQYKGVYWDKANQRWVSRIVVSYKDIYIGSFSSELEAAHAYDI
ncbi:MAG: HNH endonuclease, partial [Chloroflexota bacterium]|nr:HNH endonuclease [Chloroflexota bacterium]